MYCKKESRTWFTAIDWLRSQPRPGGVRFGCNHVIHSSPHTPHSVSALASWVGCGRSIHSFQHHSQ